MTELFLITRPSTCWKPDYFFLACKKGQKEDKNVFATESVQIISKIASKTFATQCFFTDHLNWKTVAP